MMRMWILSGDFPPCISGVGDFTYFLADRWVRQGGGELTVVTRRHPGIAAPPSPPGVRVLQPLHTMTIAEFHRVWRLVRQERPDVMNIQFTQNMYTWRRWGILYFVAVLRLFSSARIVITFHEFFDPLCHGVGSFLRGWPQRLRAGFLLLLTHGALVTVASRLQWCRRIFFWKKERLAETLISGNVERVPLSTGAREQLRSRYGLEKAELVFSLFGHVTSDKDFPLLLRVAGRLRDEGVRFRLLIIGRHQEGRFFRKLKRLEADLGLRERVAWTGQVESREVSHLLQMTDLYLTPYVYGAGNRNGSILAAFAHGLPLVTTRGRYTPGYWEEGVHLLSVSPGDEEGFYRQVSRLIRDEVLRRRLGERLLRLNQCCYTWEAIAVRTRQYLERFFLPA